MPPLRWLNEKPPALVGGFLFFSVWLEDLMLDLNHAVTAHVRRLTRDEDGGELLEYALIAGLIIMAAIAAIKVFSGTISTAFTDLGGEVADPGGTGG